MRSSNRTRDVGKGGRNIVKKKRTTGRKGTLYAIETGAKGGRVDGGGRS